VSKVLTRNAIIQCSHGGTLQIPVQGNKLKSGGIEAITEQQLLRAKIIGCPQTGAGIAPCSGIDQVTAGPSTKLKNNGQAVVLDSLQGVTNGNPSGGLTVVNPGQVKLGSV